MKRKKLLMAGMFLLLGGMISLCQDPSSDDPTFHYPVPEGQYRVGTRYLSLIDHKRPDIHTTEKDDFRKISLQIWYPADPGPGSLPLSYYGKEIADKFLEMGMFHESFLQDIAAHPSFSFLDAAILKMDDPFPVVLHSASGVMNANIFLFENLASMGYVVISIGHPHWCLFYFDHNGDPYYPDYEKNLHYQKMWEEERSEVVMQLKEQITLAQNTDDKIALLEKLNQAMPEEIADVELWVQDLDFVVGELAKLNGDQQMFHGMLDLDRIAISGYSKGGVVAAHACMTDQRFAAGINLSGFMFGDLHLNPIKVPFMNLESIESWCENCVPINDIIYDNAESDLFMIQINGATHGNFTDLSAYKKYISPDLDGLLGSIDGLRFLKIQSEYICRFLEKYLKGNTSNSMDELAGIYPEVRFKANGIAPVSEK